MVCVSPPADFSAPAGFVSAPAVGCGAPVVAGVRPATLSLAGAWAHVTIMRVEQEAAGLFGVASGIALVLDGTKAFQDSARHIW